MGAPTGNEFWKARSSHGRKPIYDDPNKLQDAIEQYFQWVHDNPFIEYKPMIEQGLIANADIPKMRPMLIGECARYVGLNTSSWAEYKEKDGFTEIIKEAEEIIRNQKLAGAMSGFFKENIVARHLGIKDGVDADLGNKKDKPFKVEYV